ncbi:hypothetical protein KM031_00900 [Gemmobacter fulvus]|uniref:Calcium-binding protein n=1 Tax=Gemmobacter fulvus TaxID=2840474 RepID=A0A975S1X0_9RHOB|nr:calcium-binding protein [Gemmobacter fulvus]MBT9245147.1 hypothetical protein [Gemmobacter fulvus]QWK90515.1 hypothetical protein KM031_00900 [Gemmobacter fulvus]
MTTYTLSGFSVTTTSGTPTGVAATSLNYVVSGNHALKYALTTPASGAFSPIEIQLSRGSTAPLSVTIGSTRLDLEDDASIAVYTWGDGNRTLVLQVDAGTSNQRHFFALGGDTLPTFASAAAYNSFLSGVTISSALTDMRESPRPGATFKIEMLDSYDGKTENDVVTGNALHDDWSTTALNTGAGNDVVTGMAGNDKIILGVGNDVASGGGGNDSIKGDNGNDSISGGNGLDTLVGGNGNDSLLGEANSDKILAGFGDDTVFGGDGNDRVEASAGIDFVDGGAGDDTILGGAGNDSLVGGDDNDVITGGTGADVLEGNSGADRINGNEGADMIFGGAGNDTMIGGSGADTFVLDLGTGDDRVMDFRDNVDTLSLSEDLGFTTAAEALEFASQNGRNVLFTFEDGDTLIINNMKLAALENDISIF